MVAGGTPGGGGGGGIMGMATGRWTDAAERGEDWVGVKAEAGWERIAKLGLPLKAPDCDHAWDWLAGGDKGDRGGGGWTVTLDALGRYTSGVVAMASCGACTGAIAAGSGWIVGCSCGAVVGRLLVDEAVSEVGCESVDSSMVRLCCTEGGECSTDMADSGRGEGDDEAVDAVEERTAADSSIRLDDSGGSSPAQLLSTAAAD